MATRDPLIPELVDAIGAAPLIQRDRRRVDQLARTGLIAGVRIAPKNFLVMRKEEVERYLKDAESDDPPLAPGEPREDPVLVGLVGQTGAAELLGLTRQWVHELYLDGELPGEATLGNGYLVFRRVEVEAYKLRAGG